MIEAFIKLIDKMEKEVLQEMGIQEESLHTRNYVPKNLKTYNSEEIERRFIFNKLAIIYFSCKLKEALKEYENE